MRNEEKIIQILEKITDKLDALNRKVDMLSQKVDMITDDIDEIDLIEGLGGLGALGGLERGQGEIFITIEETQCAMTNPIEKIDTIEEEIKELRNDLSNIQQITAMNLSDIGRLKANK